MNKMYNPEITDLINKNFKLQSLAMSIIREYNITSDINVLKNKIAKIDKQFDSNRDKIKKLRGEN